MKEEHVVNKSKPAASSTLNENGQTGMSKVFKEMNPWCSVYDVEFKNLMDEHELGV